MPRYGKPLPFIEAVEAFKIKNFVASIVESGADYLIFTITHGLQKLPAPHPVIEKILPGRTTKRDLIMEIANGLESAGKHLILYYNHSCNSAEDLEWENAVGYHDKNKEKLTKNLCNIVSHMGNKYGKLIKGWWFDSSYSLDPSGPHNTVSTDMTGFRFPWEKYTEAAKSGFPGRLVTYNAGINYTYLYTTHQDYWSGEMTDLNNPPKSRYLKNGLQWHGWTCLDDKAWVHTKADKEIPEVLYSDEELFKFLEICRKQSAPMTFNAGIYQDGIISPAAVRQLKRLGKYL